MTNPLGEGWKRVHRNTHGDEIYFHEDDALIKVVMGAPCTLHDPGPLCLSCMLRQVELDSVGRRALDPLLSPLVTEAKVSSDFPDRIALVNPIAHNAFAMALDQPRQFTATKNIHTSKHPDGARFKDPVCLVDHKTESAVCDANLMQGFRVKLGDGLSEEYIRQLWNALFTLEIDGEAMVKARPLKELLSQKEIPLPRPVAKMCMLFLGHALRPGGEADMETWLGYMLPNGTKINAFLEGVPAGGGLVELEISWTLASYSTKGVPDSDVRQI